MDVKKIAMIGANGYIARNLICLLQKEKPEIELELYDLAERHVDGAEHYHCVNMLEEELERKIDFSCDLIYMFAGKTGSVNGFDQYEVFLDTNERALLNVLNAYRKSHSEAKLIFPSTRLVYKGKEGALQEDAEKEFKTIYAINKFACEQYLKQYQNVFGVKYCTFRICLPYGTLIPNATSYGTAEFMLSKAMKGENISLYGDGSVRRTLTYMGDLCEILIQGAFCDACVNDVYNIGGEDYSLREMAELIAGKYRIGVDYVDYPEVAQKIESGSTVFDDTRLKSRIPVTYHMSFSEWCSERG